MGRGSDDIESIMEWISHCFSCYESGNMCHISHRDCSHFSRYFDEFLIIKFSWICRKSCQNNLWLMFVCQSPQFFVINLSCLRIFHFVSDKVEDLGDIGHGMSVCEVSTM